MCIKNVNKKCYNKNTTASVFVSWNQLLKQESVLTEFFNNVENPKLCPE